MIPLADAAPTGAGLAIVGVILLAFAALALGVAILVVVLIVKAVRRRGRPQQPVQGWPAQQPGPPA